jgi:imidazole glycerol-phosphate synthase subunit HisF
MLSKRIIPCLDVRNGKLTKGIKFEGNVDIGDPVETARRYYEEGADEIVFYDITASHEGRGIMLKVVEAVASQIFIPFSVGGGISTVADMRDVLLAGAEKISVNSAAVKTPHIISEGAAAFGSQCIVVGMDVLRVPKARPSRPATRSSSTAAASIRASTPCGGPRKWSDWAPGNCASIPSMPTAPRTATS